MDTPSSKNGSYLVFAVAIVAVVALVVGILALTRINKLAGQVGDVAVADFAVRIETVEGQAKKAADDSSRATTRVTGLSTDTQRAFDQVGTELASLRTSVNKLTSDTQAITDRLAAAPVRSAPPSASSGGSGATAPEPGTLADDGSYVVKSGDNLGRIATSLGITLAELQAANPGVDPRKLRIGQKLVVPKRN
ncbi:hypothetical protein ASA1KI_05760 [Opitutales bacterium ASA1]|uniref:LysM peptidoglycan-binding domain-containing protein n=1 Tax=Congregicoccus parvus TaxID=3081749 RepID=UPI002B2CCCDF|nr:hypothetical protein ASA1KI_05760 [Opitutales bacterium ASA1]